MSNFIGEKRKMLGLTQKEAAEALGISLNGYQHYEYSKLGLVNAQANTFYNFATLYGLTMEEMLDLLETEVAAEK